MQLQLPKYRNKAMSSFKWKVGTSVLHIAFSVCLFGKGVFQKLRMHVKKKEINITKESPFVLVGKAISGLL